MIGRSVAACPRVRIRREDQQQKEREETAMADMGTTQQFIDALQILERDRDPTEMVGLFMENSEVGNIVSHRTFIGLEGAQEFWETYRDTFGEVASTFR